MLYLCVLLAIPIITISNSAVTAREGSNVIQLICNVQTVPSPPAVFHWYKDGLLLSNNNKYDINFENKELKLIIINIEQSDEGVYMCFVNNTFIPATANALITLNITRKSIFV